MIEKLTHRKATIHDLRTIINLLLEDDLSQTRESIKPELDPAYIDAFHRIDTNFNQYLMVVENGREIVGTCHLTITPSLTYMGQTRMQIEAVRIIEKYRGQKIGAWMIQEAIKYGTANGATIIQLTTHKSRTAAKSFYEKLGFLASHEGMKIYLEKTV